MAQMRENPDRDFSADAFEPSDAEALRLLLKTSEVADLFDAAVRRRVGEAIARTVFDTAKPGW
jgi:hypothetical protein